MRFVRVPQHIVAEFTHYKDRPLSWIKLERRWLDDYGFTRLPLSQRGVLIHLWLLAARMGNEMPADPEWLAYTLRASENDFDIDAFVSAGYLEYCDEVESVGASVSLPLAERLVVETVEGSDEQVEEAAEPAMPLGRSRQLQAFEPPLVDEDDEDLRPRSTRVRRLKTDVPV
jgi:hypothetical protein